MSRLFVTSLPTSPLCILLPLGLHTSPPTFPIPQTSSDLVPQPPSCLCSLLFLHPVLSSAKLSRASTVSLFILWTNSYNVTFLMKPLWETFCIVLSTLLGFLQKKKFAFLVNCLTLPTFRSERINTTYWYCHIFFYCIVLRWGHMQQFFLFDRYLNTYKKYQDLLNNKAETEINAFIQDEPVLLALSKVLFFFTLNVALIL